MKDKTFASENDSIQFYEDRYIQGYMEDWDPEKKKRVIQLIAELNLPSKGKALDFGCGNGVLTQIIKEALPNWEVFGCDVSEIAVKNATKRRPDLRFFFHDQSPKFAHEFNFIFTHHVFEHVYDVAKSWLELAQYGSDDCIVTHILPCGNKYSFEYNYCVLFKNGIDTNKGNRFFFEDPGHLRRMTTEEMENYAKANDYRLFKSYYAHQYYGALNWISNSGDSFITEFTNTSDALDERSKKKILAIRRKLRLLSFVKSTGGQSITSQLKVFIRKPSLITFKRAVLITYATCANSYYEKMTIREWRYSRHKRNGSEMFLCFKKGE